MTAYKEYERKLAQMQPVMMLDSIERMRDMLSKDATMTHPMCPDERQAMARACITLLRGLGYLNNGNGAVVPKRHLSMPPEDAS